MKTGEKVAGSDTRRASFDLDTTDRPWMAGSINWPEPSSAAQSDGSQRIGESLKRSGLRSEQGLDMTA
jgi:hypothetical protein